MTKEIRSLVKHLSFLFRYIFKKIKNKVKSKKIRRKKLDANKTN